MNKIGRALGAAKTMVLGDRPKTPTELAVSIRKDIVAMKKHVAYLDSEKVNQLCGEFHISIISAYDSNPFHNLVGMVNPEMERRVKAEGEIKQCYRAVLNKVERYVQQEQYRSGYIAYVWKQCEGSINEATLGELPEKLEEFAQALERGELVK